jgi:hypothetical protein
MVSPRVDPDTDSEIDPADFGSLFVEPENFYEKEKPPTFVTHKLRSGEELRLRLVGQNPLWVSCQIHAMPLC